MEEKLIKNVEHRKAFCLKDLVDYEAGKVAAYYVEKTEV